MANTVVDHYENHLAPIYSWMVGDFDQACSCANDFLTDLQLPGGEQRFAVDLGCGHGVFSIPLAKRGYRVVGLDSSRILLDELEAKSQNLPVESVQADILDFPEHTKERSVSLIACMGDTLTHLSNPAEVERLVKSAGDCLHSEGRFIVSFRDYASSQLDGPQRFIPVRSDENLIHTCFLDYQQNVVEVHDILHRKVDERWEMSVSSYSKIRLDPEWIISLFSEQDFSLVYRTIDRGMLYFAFSKK